MAKASKQTVDRGVEMFDAWKRGVPIHQLVIDFAPITRSTARKLLTVASGGVERFKELRAKGAGGRAADPVEKKEKAPRERRTSDEPPRPRIDDSNVPMILSAKIADGWKHQRLRGDEMLYISPEGVEYVRASDTQPADLIHIGIPEGLPPVRLRRYAVSGKAQRAKQDASDAAKLDTQQRAQRDAGRARRRTKLEKRVTKTGR